jgi:hypothetical protein
VLFVFKNTCGNDDLGSTNLTVASSMVIDSKREEIQGGEHSVEKISENSIRRFKNL